MPGRTVAEVQADPEFQALPIFDQQEILRSVMAAGVASYKGAPDLPLETGAGDISDKTAARGLRYGGPIAGAMLGPAGFLASLGTAGAVGAGSSAAADAAEGKDFNLGKTALAGGLNTAGAIAARPLGALAGVAKAKLGGGRLGGDMDLSGLQGLAGEAAKAKGLLSPRVSAAGEAIEEALKASGGKLPINASGLKPSVEMVRKGIPYKQPGGKEMYGSLRQAAKEQRPDYDKLLKQYQSVHALGDKISLKEILAGGMLGGGGGMEMGWPGLLAVLLPRLANSARFAPSAPGIQSGLSAGLGALSE